MAHKLRRVGAAVVALVAGTAAGYAVTGTAAVDAAAPSTASVTAVDFDWSMPGGSAYTATIAAGGTVGFSYPAGVSIHNVDFTGASPTACTQTAGATVGPASPLPAAPEAPGWSGVCHFDTPGTYMFVCDEHNYMKGTIQVEERSTTTTTGTPGGGTTATETSTGSGPGEQTQGGSSSTSGGSSSPFARPRVSVARRQRGAVVRGTVTTPAGRSRITVTAYLHGGGPRTRIGSLTTRSKGTGATAFAVKLDAARRRALQRAHRLAVELRVVVTPAVGRPVTTKTVPVALRDR
jgi:plastocyanin